VARVTVRPNAETAETDQKDTSSIPTDTTEAGTRRTLFASSIVARAWLWFLAGCLLITLVPMAFGWRPYVVQSGSMTPRIHVGDVILAAPVAIHELKPGQVIVFDDPDRPGRVLSHRIVRIDPNGSFVTNGDANPTADAIPVPPSNIRGLGRLLVRFVGLPWIWVRNGSWLLLALFAAGIVGAGWLVAKDREQARLEEERDSDPDASGDDDSPGGPDDESAGTGPHGSTTSRVDDSGGSGSAGGGSGRSGAGAQEKSGPLGTSATRQAVAPTRRYRLRRFARSLVVAISLSAALLVPLPAYAAFKATTTLPGNAWSVPTYSYPTVVAADGPYQYYRMDDASGTTAADSSGNGFTGTYSPVAADFTFGVTGALTGYAPNKAVTFTNAASCLYSPVAAKLAAGPTTYTLETWFKVSSGYNQGGKLVGFETSQTGVSNSGSGGQYDRMIYMDGGGHLWFGVWTGAATAIESPAAYNDGNWHYVVATMSATGMALYMDGVQVATNANTVSQTYASGGWWRFGCGNLNSWGTASTWTGPNAPSAQQNYPLLGSLDEMAVYSSALSAQEIAFHYWLQ
jgi:signal peptidase I